MLLALGQEQPDAMLFLGDGERDLAAVYRRFPDLPVYAVRGNCDYYSDLPQWLTCELDGIPVLFTHGHLFGVKYDLIELEDAARSVGARIVLFGHTHEAYLREDEALTVLNPGSIGDYGAHTYAVIETENGSFTARIEEI
jgi:putative phosphoesterase